MTEAPLSYQSKRLPLAVWCLVLAAAIGLLGYTTYRALTLSITFDEVWSHNVYATASWEDILRFHPPSANNHPGNSLLMKLSMHLLGDTTFSIRLPNLIAHGIYLVFSIALARRFRQPVWVLLAFFLLNFHPYLLDFFSLARGYGLAMAMVMAALYHLFAFRENAFSHHLAWNMGCAALSVVFNLSFLHFFLANGLVMTLLILSHARAWNGTLKTALIVTGGRLLPLIATSIGLYLYLRQPVKALVAHQQLYYGGSTGFWTDTVFSLAHATLYKVDFWKYDVALILDILIVLLCAMVVAFGIESAERKFSLRLSPGVMALLLLCIPALTTSLQHYWTGSLLLIYRTALFLVPVFMLAVVALLRTIAKLPELRFISITLGTMLTLGVAGINLKTLNFTHTAEWPFDADTQHMMRDLEADYILRHHGHQATIGLSWQLRSGLNYYLRENDFDWLQPPGKDGCQPGKDYYFVLNKGEGCHLPPKDLPFGAAQGCTLIQVYPISNTELWAGPPNAEHP